MHLFFVFTAGLAALVGVQGRLVVLYGKVCQVKISYIYKQRKRVLRKKTNHSITSFFLSEYRIGLLYLPEEVKCSRKADFKRFGMYKIATNAKARCRRSCLLL